MRRQRISEVIGSIDEKYVEEANSYVVKSKRNHPGWIKWAAMAACLALVLIGIIMLPNNPSKADYNIVYQSGRCYVQFSEEFKDNNFNGNQNINNIEVIPFLGFDSLTDMKDQFLNYKLPNLWIRELLCFEKSENGFVEIPNMNKLYTPIHSHELEEDGATLTENCYYVELKNQSGKSISWRYYYKDEAYVEEYNSERDEYIHSVISQTGDADRNAIVYTYTGYNDVVCKRVVYTITTETATLFVDEFYNRKDAKSPNDVVIYGSSEYGHFIVDFIFPDERPTLELISAFGIKPLDE